MKFQKKISRSIEKSLENAILYFFKKRELLGCCKILEFCGKIVKIFGKSLEIHIFIGLFKVCENYAL